ncbi:MAG: hypothetical protein WDM85_14490 [Caulobacteraceae bacterium]
MGLRQLKSLRRKVYEIAADAGGAKAPAYLKSAAREGVDEKTAQVGAKALESKRDAFLERGERHEVRHGPPDRRLDPAAHGHRHRHLGDHPAPPLALVRRARPQRRRPGGRGWAYL